MLSAGRFKLLRGILLWAFAAGAAATDDDLTILRITPQGDNVPPSRQIVFEFNRPVVPLGRMERDAREIPIRIRPALNCEWRWLSPKTLACQLTEADQMKPATRYAVEMSPRLQSVAGASMHVPVRHAFTTQRPMTSGVYFSTWDAPGQPVIRVAFNQPVTRNSVKRHVSFVVGGQRIAARPVSDPDQRGAGKPAPLPPSERNWFVTPERELPLNQHAELRAEPGLKSVLGPERSVEANVVVAFDTFPAFRFIGVKCTRINADDLVLIPRGQPLDTQPKCDPLQGTALVFSAPVINEEVKAHTVLTPDLAGGRKDYDPWANQPGYSQLRRPHKQGEYYEVWLPELLRAYQEYRIDIGASLRDEFGRTPVNLAGMRFRTDHRRPNLVLAHPHAVLEQGIDSEVPVYVTNLQQADIAHSRLTPERSDEHLQKRIIVPQVEDISFALPLEVRDMLAGASGVVAGTISTTPPAASGTARFLAQVTPFQVHVKLGHFNSLVWVTDLASGEPVDGVKVSVYATAEPTRPPAQVLAETVTDEIGIGRFAGTDVLDPALKLINEWRDDQPRLVLHLQKQGDMALLPLDYDYHIWPGQVNRYPREKYGHLQTWGTTAQGVYRIGDTIQYKLYVRHQDEAAFTAAPDSAYTLQLVDPTGEVAHRIDNITLSEYGTFDGEFTLPQTAAVGWYQFKLSADFTEMTWQPMRVLVSDFTPSSFKVRTELNGDAFGPDDTMEITTTARLHAGGPYTDANTRVTVTLKPMYFTPKDPKAEGFYFQPHDQDYPAERQLFQTESTVDSNGDLVTPLVLPDSEIIYGRMSVESAVRDDRGKDVANIANADYVGRDRFVGLKNTQWVYREDRAADVEYVVVDKQGRLVAGVPVQVKIERLETKAARVKGAGNAYLTRYVHSWEKVSECEDNSGGEARICRFQPAAPGDYRITASVTDTRGKQQTSGIHAWVAGKGQVVWEMPANNELPIIPETGNPDVGDTARYLIKNPYPGAKALVSIERYGVLKSWVQTLETSTPILEFPVEADFVPGFYLSVTVFSPRVDKPLGPDQVDLGKPTFSMGYVAVPVNDPYKQLVIDMSAGKEVYRPGDTVDLSLQVKPRHGADEEPKEVAVVALDEAVFDLIRQGTGYFDPYRGFYRLEDLDVSTYSLISRLVGRQKFEKKGADPGGDGGAGDLGLRSLFKFVGYWNPSIEIAPGETHRLSFQAPDNLTGWRVFALAVTAEDLMGLGEAVFKVNKPIELRPVMPNQITEGDRFKAGFSVMNRTGEQRSIAVELSATGALADPTGQRFELRLAPFKRETVWLPLQSKRAGEIEIKGFATDGQETDGLRHLLPVHKRRSLLTAASYGTTDQDNVIESILFPQAIHTDAGALTVTLSPTVIGNIEGAFRYARGYPYSCWEQRLSKAAMAAQYLHLKPYIDAAFAWEGSDTLPQATLDEAAGFQAPGGGMVYWRPQDAYVSPYLSAYTALVFNWLRDAGYRVPAPVEDKLHAYLENLLRKDVMPEFYSKGMASTVRAVALAALAARGKLTLDALQRYQQHLPQMSLFGLAHYLQAALAVDQSEEQREDVIARILAHASQSGGKFQFNEAVDTDFARILYTPGRANCALLDAFSAFPDNPQVSDIPFKLVRSITQTRGARDHWDNTQENMFCMNALVNYSKVYEAVDPALRARVKLDAELLGKTAIDDRRAPAVTFTRPTSAADPGRSAELSITREGQGRLYYATQLSYAPLAESAESINAGIEIRREYSVERDGQWQLLADPMKIRRGELVKVDLFVSLPSSRNFVVVDDPVPGGLEPVNRDLATASVVDADKGSYQMAGGSWWYERDDWTEYDASRWSFYHQELRHHAARFYADYLPPGNYHLSYTAQAIASGEFAVLPVHSEEMYDPDVYGKGLPATLIVEE